MKPRNARTLGTSLVELLVAVAFLGICVGVILNAVGTSGTRTVYAKRRALALGLAKSEIDRVRATARSSALTAGTVTTVPSVPGWTGSIAQQRTITTVAGSTGVYRVTVTLTWNERLNGVSRSDSLTLETLVRAPDA